jgi:hypothetical protein
MELSYNKLPLPWWEGIKGSGRDLWCHQTAYSGAIEIFFGMFSM